MNPQIKTAIQAAEMDLEKNRKEALKKQIYDYLKSELDAIESIEQQQRKLNEQKKAHEENIKNIKQGNLKAIEERNKSFGWNFTSYPQFSYSTSSNLNYTTFAGSAFYSNYVAGQTIPTGSGRLVIF